MSDKSRGIILLLLWALILTVRGDLFFLFSPVFGLPLLCLFVFEALVIRVSHAAFLHQCSLGRRAKRLLWLVPLLSFCLRLSIELALLFGPYACGHPDFWPRLTSLSPSITARFAVDVFALIVVGTLVLFGVLCREFITRKIYLENERETGAADRMTNAGVPAGLALIAILLVQWKLSMQDNLLFFSAMLSYSVGQAPRTCLAKLNNLLEDYPDSALADTALLRAGRIQEEDLNDPEAARATYARLLREHPSSAWCDDADFRTARILATKTDHVEQSVQALNSFIARHPLSCFADDALLLLTLSYTRDGETLKAQDTLRRLIRQYPRGRILSSKPSDYPFLIRNTVGECEKLIKMD